MEATLGLKRNWFRNAWRFLPEICFSIVSLFCVVNSIISLFTREEPHISTFIFLFVMLALFACLTGQFFWQKQWLSIVLAIIFGLASFYMWLAVLSEYAEMPEGYPGKMRLLTVGSSISLSLLVLAMAMPWKYAKTLYYNQKLR